MKYIYPKEQIKGSGLRMGVSINRSNCLHLPELIQYAERDLVKAEGMPHATKVQIDAKIKAVEEAKRILDERQQKLNLYKEIFPDLFQ
jgi:hypothetical protein